MATNVKLVKRPQSSSSIASASAVAARGGDGSKAVNTIIKSQSRPPMSNEKRKIETSDIKRPLDSKLKSPIGTTVIKAEVKMKSEPGTSKTITTTTKTTATSTTTKTKVKEKKVYTLAGQKFDPPEEREPLRIFYESLSKQIPSSEMAEFWMMEHGLLSPERSKKAFEKKQRKQKQIRMGTPLTSLPSSSKPESSHRQQQASKNGDNKAKKKAVDSDVDDDFIASSKRRKM
uniref:Uncharacterized protein n=1 Tax=Kalanchoe fedtschenkoi TaxID=63787 RepID=A0A7N0T5P5_KALFE